SGTASLTVYPAFTNTVTGYYNYTDSMHSLSGGCLSITKYTAVLKSFKGSLTALEKLSCHNDSIGKIKASVTSEVNGPIGTPDKYTFTWSPSTLTTTTAMGSPCSSTKTNLKSNTYICTISNGNCINTYTYNLTNPAPLTNDSIYAYYCPKDSLALVIADTGNTNYVWHPSTAVVSVTGDSAHILVQDVNKCYVTYKHNGCPDTGKVVISVTVYDAFRPDETVNVFTPNGDTRNDFFYPFYSKTLNQYQIFKQSDSYEINIYDRWGKLVYNATDYNKPWDGKTKSGHDADNGSYFFIVKYKSNCGSKADLVEKKGFVELMR
ncbi:MAG TPA: gliding motility-associated C-terminal domain-containing protein, partial [Bacteroidia bacterium]|nr:gliding motility-associated C-terminal domain-containing protein [Bacteroidia bacterium]